MASPTQASPASSASARGDSPAPPNGSYSVPVEGGDLAALHWPADAPGAPVAVLLHGITANAMAWARVAGALAGEFEVVAPDLRGRAEIGRASCRERV